MASTRSGVRQALFKESFSDPKSLYEFGESALLAMKLTADRGIAARKNASDRTFIDVYYPDLVSDPVGTVRKIYDRIGRPLTAETELRISSWLRRNAADKGGGHHYTVEEFGLTDEMIKSEMEGYLNVFGDGLAESSARNAR
jgi:hypothetical protein